MWDVTRTDRHTGTQWKEGQYSACAESAIEAIKLPLTLLLSFNLLQTLFPRAAPQDQKTSPTKLLDKCSSKSLRVKCTLMHFFLYCHWAASQSYTVSINKSLHNNCTLMYFLPYGAVLKIQHLLTSWNILILITLLFAGLWTLSTNVHVCCFILSCLCCVNRSKWQHHGSVH